MIIHNPILTGSLSLNGTTLSTGNIVTTGSNTFVGNQTLTGSLNITGSVTATGNITAQTLVVQTITSSVVYSSGSNVFGNVIGNTHQFTGSVLVTGSVSSNGKLTITTTTSPGVEIVKDASIENRYFRLTNTQASSKSWDLINQTNANSNVFQIYNATDNVAGLTITTGSFVGVGTSTPGTPLQILKDTNTNGTSVEEGNMAFTVLSAAGQSKIAMGACNAGNYGYVQVMQDATSWTNRNLSLQPRGGNVGIGATSPDQKLVINQGATGTNQGVPGTSGTTQNGILRLRPAIGVYGETLDFGMNVSPTYGWIQSTNASGLNTNYSLALNPNGGLVLVGKTTDDGLGKLQVNGNISTSNALFCKSLIGVSYSQTSGAGTGTAIVDTGLYYSSFGQSSIWMVSWGGNGNAGGSAAYHMNAVGYISVYTGWSGAAVTQYLSYTESAIFNSPNVSSLSLSVRFFSNSVGESTTIAGGDSTYQLRIKIAGYNSGYTGQDQYCYLTRVA